MLLKSASFTRLSIHIHIHIYVWVVKKTDNVPSQLLPIRQWLHGNSCAQMHELPWGHWRIGNNQEGILCLFDYIYILRSPSFCWIWALCIYILTLHIQKSCNNIWLFFWVSVGGLWFFNVLLLFFMFEM